MTGISADDDATRSARAANLLFAGPGLAHLLGNALFAVQGRCRLLTMAEGPQVAADADAILTGSERAMSGLLVLRWLLAEGVPCAHDAAAALHDLEHVLRIPLRDMGCRLEMRLHADSAALVADPAAMAFALTACMRTVTDQPHRGHEIHLEVALLVQPGSAGLELTARGGEGQGHLLPLCRAAERLRELGQAVSAGWEIGADADMLRLAWPDRSQP
jgi:hypothetical protein